MSPTFGRSQQQIESGHKCYVIQVFKRLLSRMTLASRSNTKIKTKIVIQLDIYMYIGRRKFLSQVRKSYKKKNFIMICTNKWVGYFHDLLALLGRLNLLS